MPPIAALYRPLPPRSIPSSFHMASTFCLVASSITIRFGHSRVNPSSFHLRVASIPIFEPGLHVRLEDGDRRDAQVEGGGVHARVAESDRDGPGDEEEGGRDVEGAGD